MSASEIPDTLIDLLERPVYGVLATVGRDDTAQSSPMWFELVDGTIRFTHTTGRAKYRNLQRNPSMSFTVYDPENPYRYIEVRGRLTEATPDPTGAFYQQLAKRYGNANPDAPADAADRVILVMSIEKVIGH
ncbi:PPOX class F420-dependent oxidoreductase [Microbacterium pseudoresistens]|uniref:PPOX class probable F420-dependent enzyme n=1 Tax=Microbacterium pseudoresistens TaxID=640634 RepID=A0A7Y9EV65_9MICO|nr:PPOX class F420-dependent oxidoreductase [Microbacterium pseudoresistens]NYD54391.1 PPOX class probable F420-dependent enzyme [Microbacterium pseudoresistens]